MTRGRGGFTLVELIVVAVLGTLLLGAIFQVLVTNQRTYTAQSATIQGQQSSRMALELLFNELREVSPAGGDILAMSSDSIRVRLMRKLGIVCEVDITVPLASVITVLNNSGDRFEAGDSVFLFADNNQKKSDDDVWIGAQVTTIDTTVTCLSGQAASDITFVGQAAFATDTVRVGALARSYGRATFGTAQWLGDPYLTMRDATLVPWPVAGPLKAGNGLVFTYRDAFGAVTAVPSDVRQIEVMLRTGSDVLNSLGGTVSDSITAWIYTRN